MIEVQNSKLKMQNYNLKLKLGDKKNG